MSDTPSKQPSAYYKTLLKECATASCSSGISPLDDPILTHQSTMLSAVAASQGSDLRKSAKNAYNEGGGGD
jgi:hypothetical protein